MQRTMWGTEIPDILYIYKLIHFEFWWLFRGSQEDDIRVKQEKK